jgi:hypothetical protein
VDPPPKLRVPDGFSPISGTWEIARINEPRLEFAPPRTVLHQCLSLQHTKPALTSDSDTLVAASSGLVNSACHQRVTSCRQAGSRVPVFAECTYGLCTQPDQGQPWSRTWYSLKYFHRRSSCFQSLVAAPLTLRLVYCSQSLLWRSRTLVF